MNLLYPAILFILLGANLALMLVGFLGPRTAPHPAVAPGVFLPCLLMLADGTTFQVIALATMAVLTVANVHETAWPGAFAGTRRDRADQTDKAGAGES